MEVPVSRAPIALDPLIAEAKRRRRRRWLLIAVTIGLSAAAAIAVDQALLTPSHRLSTPPNRGLGITGIPGMTMLRSDYDPATCVPFRSGPPFVPGRGLPSMGDCSLDYNASGVSV